MLRQMRLLYAKFNKLLGTLSHCSSDVKVARYQSYIVQHCIGHSCLAIIKSLKKLVKFVSHFIMFIEKYLVSLSGVVPVKCMQLIIFVTLREC